MLLLLRTNPTYMVKHALWVRRFSQYQVNCLCSLPLTLAAQQRPIGYTNSNKNISKKLKGK